MSKPTLIYTDSPRLCSPACALVSASRCLAASRVALPVYGVSTTRATTPELPSARASRPERRSSAPRSAAGRLGHQMTVSGRAPSLARAIANARALSRAYRRIRAAESGADAAGSGTQIIQIWTRRRGRSVRMSGLADRWPAGRRHGVPAGVARRPRRHIGSAPRPTSRSQVSPWSSC